MALGLLVITYGMYVEKISGSGDFVLLDGQDFNLLDNSNFLLLGA